VKKKVAILFWEGYVSVAPTVINIAQLLSENNYYIDIFTRGNIGNFPDDPVIDNCNINRVCSAVTRFSLFNRIIKKINYFMQHSVDLSKVVIL